ncbi:MAG: lysylphosphatidylglycerol synthase transmembrane domain-containing protein [Pyrinomonadaceae bacterium]
MDPKSSVRERKTATNGRAPRLIRSAIGYLLGAACLVWVFHDIRAGELPRYIGNISWRWVALAILADILSYVCQAWRWQLLLKPVGKVSIIRAAQAIYAGLFANEILPLRFGELVRAYLVSQWLSVKVSSVVPSMIVERLLDGILLTIGIGLTMSFVSLPKDLLEAGDIFAVMVLIAIAAFIYLVLPQKASGDKAASEETGDWIVLWKVRTFLTSVAEGLRAIRAAKNLYLSFAVSNLFLALQILAFWLIMHAYGLKLSVWIGVVVFLIVHLGTAIPNAPANIGTYQFFTVVGLALFGVDKTLATGFSVVVFVLLTAPLWFIGFLALGRSGFSLTHIGEKMRLVKQHQAD